MKDLEQARSYLTMAGKDYSSLRGMGDVEIFPVEVFGFHIQQAIEKSLKAWLCCLGIRFAKIHDLDELSAKIEDAGCSFPDEFEPLLAYTDFAVTFRYDAFPSMEADIDRAEVTERVGKLLEHVERVVRQAEVEE